MITNPSIFKAYDIRGVYGTDYDEDLAYRLGLAFAIMRAQELGRPGPKLVTARDMRLSSPSLQAALIKGMIDGGAQVVNLDLASTPTFYFAVANYNYDGGIQVSASHNPKDWNGFKLVRERALPVGEGTGMDDIKKMVMGTEIAPVAVKGSVIVQEGVINDQVAHDLDFVDVADLKTFKIVIDPANAMGSQYFDELFIHLPGEVERINWELDGTFPAHEADPFKPENIAFLEKAVLLQKADFGIATDGDADRIFFVDNEGHAVEPGIIRAVLAKIFLEERPGAKIAYDIRPGRITPETILKHGGNPIVTRVGHSLIKAQAIREGAFFAGESSGHFFLNMPEGCYEVPMIVALKIMAELSKSGLTFAEYIKPYKKYFNAGEINSTVADPKAKIAEIKAKYADGQQNEIDGITVEYPDFWFNVRASNTEPLLRLNLEAVSKEAMEAKRDELLQLIRS
ncbi:MAG: phosphomannomutase/phosphoglucomutase [Candidatus Falkowbacteria bacterium]